MDKFKSKKINNGHISVNYVHTYLTNWDLESYATPIFKFIFELLKVISVTDSRN
jgi:hypothetical protein